MKMVHSPSFRIEQLAGALALTVLLAAGGARAEAPAAPYQIVDRIPLHGDSNWDYLAADAGGRRVYVTHGDRVNVVDMDTYKEVGEFGDLALPHGVTIAADLNRGFISVGRTSTVVAFDLKTLQVLGTVRIPGENPDTILYDAYSKRVFTFNGYSDDASVLDAATLKVLGSVKIVGRPEAGVSDGKGHIFVNVKKNSEIVAFDAKTLEVIAHWPLAPGQEPIALGIDPQRNRLFSACKNDTVVVMDSTNGKVVSTVKIPKGIDSVVSDPAHSRFFCAVENALVVISYDAKDHYEVVQKMETPDEAVTMAFDQKTGRIFISSGELGERPPPTKEIPHPSPSVTPGSYRLLVVQSGPKK